MASVDTSSQPNPEHEHLLYELETSDTSSVGLVLRAIYDGDEHQKFMEKLDARIKNHDRDIERMCNFHYQGFIDSIRELLQVRTQAEKLKHAVTQMDEELQLSSKGVIQKAEEVVKYRKIQHNIACTIESLSYCLPVLEMYSKLGRQMKEKRYYPALKTLEQLEHTFLPRVSKYRFAQTMRTSVPCLRERIKDASMSELKDFLENIREVSAKIGATAMRHAAEQQSVELGVGRRKKKRKAPPPPNPFTGELELEPEADSLLYDREEELSAQDSIDLSPVYRCLHIYSVLGAKEAFESYYQAQREEQARLTQAAVPNETSESYKSYFSGIVGFFVVEDRVLNTADGLVTRSYLDAVWEKILTSVIKVIKNNCESCEDPNQLLKIKRLVLLFSFTLGGYGYQVNRISELLLSVRDYYIKLLMKQWVDVFRRIFDDDNYHPIEANSPSEHNDVTSIFPYKDESLEKAHFPRKFPFSQFVPKVYAQVKEFVCFCLKFTEDLNLSQTELEDMVRKSANILLKTTLSNCLTTLIMKPTLGISQLIQISINTNFLEKACIYLEEFIISITGSSTDNSHVARLQGQSMFKNARALAEGQIYILLNRKIKDFIDPACYDWLMNEPGGVRSEYLVDLLAFLKSTFQNFTNLPENVAQAACMSSCKYLAKQLMKLLLHDDIKNISMGALQQFNLDVIQCELFASSEPVKGIQDGQLQECFSDLRQLLDLFMTWDWSLYFHDFGKVDSKYARVDPQSALMLLEKIKEADKKKKIFSSLTNRDKKQKDKRKLLETVLKQLKPLVPNMPKQMNRDEDSE